MKPTCWLPGCKNPVVRHPSGALRTFYFRSTDVNREDMGLAHACNIHQPSSLAIGPRFLLDDWSLFAATRLHGGSA